MTKFSRDRSLLANLIMAIIEAHPLGESDDGGSNEHRLSQSLKAIIGKKIGTGSVQTDDATVLWRMWNEQQKDEIYFGPNANLFKQGKDQENIAHVSSKKRTKARSVRELAEEQFLHLSEDLKIPAVERVRKKFKKHEQLLRDNDELQWIIDVERQLEFQTLAQIIKLLNVHGLGAEIEL